MNQNWNGSEIQDCLLLRWEGVLFRLSPVWCSPMLPPRPPGPIYWHTECFNIFHRILRNLNSLSLLTRSWMVNHLNQIEDFAPDFSLNTRYQVLHQISVFAPGEFRLCTRWCTTKLIAPASAGTAVSRDQSWKKHSDLWGVKMDFLHRLCQPSPVAWTGCFPQNFFLVRWPV